MKCLFIFLITAYNVLSISTSKKSLSPNPFPFIDIEKEHSKSLNFGKFNGNSTKKAEKEIKKRIIDNLLSRRVEPLKMSRELRASSYIEKKQAISRLPDPEYFLGYNYVDILIDLPPYGVSDTTPWSGYYWAHRYGMLSARYPLDSKNSMCIIQNNVITQWYTYPQSVGMYIQPQEDYYLRRRGQNYYNQYVNAYYSPAEKIDLLFGDPNFSLTNYMKSQGSRYMTDNDVPSWLGLCNGWAPASYLEPRCKNSITLTAYDNVTQIQFLPDDMEALASLFYAQSPFNIKMIGGRCTDTSDTSCEIMNAGVFAIVVANQIGINKENLIFDPKIDNEIWNFPAFSYTFQFYIPTQREKREYSYTLTYEMLMTPTQVSQVNDPIFRKISSSSSYHSASYYGGIRLCLRYTAEDYPYHSENTWDDTTGQDCYDMILALSSKFQIIDGFWDQDDIPTYLWTPENKKTILGPYDNYVESFDGSVEDIRKYRAYAIYSSRSGTILKKVMEFFMEKAGEE